MENKEKINHLNKDIDKLIIRQNKYKKEMMDNLSFIENKIKDTIDNINKDDSNIESKVKELGKNLLNEKPLTKIQQSNKNIYKYFSKINKDCNELINERPKLEIYNKNLDSISLNQSISEYFWSNDWKNLDKIFREESKIGKNHDLIKKFSKVKEINIVVDEIKQKNTFNLCKWIEKYSNNFNQINSEVPYLTNQIVILEMIKNKEFKDYDDLLKIIYKKLFRFFNSNRESINKLLTSLLFIDKDKNVLESNYSYLYDYKNWETLAEKFKYDSFLIINYKYNNPLFTIFKAGYLSQNQFENFNKKIDINNQNELPFNINLPEEFYYHNYIICPVSKEICTSDNPPMFIGCGHVVSEKSLKKIMENKDKKSIMCPICNTRQKVERFRKIKI